eukprot:257091-Pleurochrysis_carterae.AAC.6
MQAAPSPIPAHACPVGTQSAAAQPAHGTIQTHSAGPIRAEGAARRNAVGCDAQRRRRQRWQGRSRCVQRRGFCTYISC